MPWFPQLEQRCGQVPKLPACGWWWKRVSWEGTDTPILVVVWGLEGGLVYKIKYWLALGTQSIPHIPKYKS